METKKFIGLNTIEICYFKGITSFFKITLEKVFRAISFSGIPIPFCSICDRKSWDVIETLIFYYVVLSYLNSLHSITFQLLLLFCLLNWIAWYLFDIGQNAEFDNLGLLFIQCLEWWWLGQILIILRVKLWNSYLSQSNI